MSQNPCAINGTLWYCCDRCGKWYIADTLHNCTPTIELDKIYDTLERIAAALEAIAQEMTKPGL